MNKFIVPLCLVLACTSAPSTQLRTSALVASTMPGCVNPVDFGAIASQTPTTVLSPDARPAFEAALAVVVGFNGGEVCWPAGHFRVTRAPIGSYNHFAAMSVHSSNVTISGAGKNLTFIEMAGDQGNSALAVLEFDPGAKNVVSRDFTIDTMAAYNTDEQTHAIEVGSGLCPLVGGVCLLGGVEDVFIDNMHFVHGYVVNPDGTTSRKGDSIRIFGNTPETPVINVRITNSTFFLSARSHIAYQRNVYGLLIANNHFKPSRIDQAIDGEPTGGVNDRVSRCVIVANIFDDDATAQGDYAVAITGVGGAHNLVAVADNVFNGRGLALYRVSDISVANNVFDATMKNTSAVIEVSNIASKLNIGGNTIQRRGVAGAMMRFQPHSGGIPSGIDIHDNTMVNGTAGNGIQLEAVSQMSIVNNSMLWTVSAPQSHGIYLRTTAAISDDMQISGNRIKGMDLYAGIRLEASPFPIEVVQIVGNQVRGAVRSLLCTQTVAGLFHQPIVHSANRYEVAPNCTVTSLVPSAP